MRAESRGPGAGACTRRAGLLALILAASFATVLPAGSVADQASQPSSPAAARLDAGENQTCVTLPDASARCWGLNADGELGYGNENDVGDDETPASVGPVDFGAGRAVRAISTGTYHSCALLEDGSVRCWGYGADGRLGYGNTANVLSPASVGGVDLGPGRTAVAISAGGAHTCAIRDDGRVLCWGFGFDGQLGYGDAHDLGDTSAPGSHPPVDLGAGHTARAISSGGLHTCAILDDGTVRCWGFGFFGELGYGDRNNIGDSSTPTPASVGPVYLGAGRSAVAISAGGAHTCAILDNGKVLCWGFGGKGQLGYGDTANLGDAQIPGLTAPVNLGPGRTATAISAGENHTCAILDDGSVRCWGDGADGRLGYGNARNVGDVQSPASAGPVALGPGRTAVAISAGGAHTCALLDDGSVRCWGSGGFGQLGYCATSNVGEAQTPASTGPVNLQPGDGGVTCPAPAAVKPPKPTRPSPSAVEAARARALRGCLAAVRIRASRDGRRRCLHRYGRTPGRIGRLRARARGATTIELDFRAAGTDAGHPPPASSYVVKQSLRPIRSAGDFRRAHALCRGACRFSVTEVGGPIALMVTSLRARTTYYYAVAARDNVSARVGPRSRAAKARTA